MGLRRRSLNVHQRYSYFQTILISSSKPWILTLIFCLVDGFLAASVVCKIIILHFVWSMILGSVDNISPGLPYQCLLIVYCSPTQGYISISSLIVSRCL